MNKNDNNRKIYVLVIIIIIIFTVLSLFLYLIMNKNKNYVSLVKKTSNESNTEESICPKINIDTEEIDKINKELEEYCQFYSSSSSRTITYQYNVKNNILSILIKLVDNTLVNINTKFVSHNIDLKNHKIISDEELLSKYKFTTSEIEESVNQKIYNLFLEESKQGYIEKNECDYDCYLSIRMIEPLSENISLYLSNKGLTVYKAFNLYSEYDDYEFFENEDFQFKLRK